eukprot:1701226-Rhodomonas_salina.1
MAVASAVSTRSAISAPSSASPSSIPVTAPRIPDFTTPLTPPYPTLVPHIAYQTRSRIAGG